jgi:two-component system, NtrC family, sensor kinase
MPRRTPRFRLWMKLAVLAALGVVAMHAVHLVIGNQLASRALLDAQAQLGGHVARLLAEDAADALLVNDPMTLHAVVGGAAAAAEGDVAYCFVVRNERVVATTFEGATPPALVKLRGPGELVPVLVRLDGAEVLDVIQPILGGSLGAVRLGLGMSRVQRLRRELAVHLGELAVGVILAGIVAAFFTGRAIARPVNEMLSAADRFDPAIAATGPVVEARGSDEVAVLGRRFNEMMRRLEAAHAEQERARQKALETERLAALGSLVAGVAHEVNNPLAGLKNCVRRLERNDLGEAKRSEYLALMDEGLSRIGDVMRRLLDFARPQRTRLEPAPAASLAADAIRLVGPLLERRRVSVPLGAADDGVVLADRRQIGQALVNLLLNAAYVTPDGGEVRVSVRRAGGRVGIAVADDGPGIPPEIRDRILDPFFSTKPEGEGTGLGLTVTRTIADAHGGELAFEFPPRGGTVAVLWLAAAERAPARA